MTNRIYIHFWGRKSRSSSKIINLQLRVTVNEIRAELGSVNIRIHTSKWSQLHQKVKGNGTLATQINQKLLTIESDILVIYNHFEVNKTQVTALKIKEIYKGEATPRMGFELLFEEYCNFKKHLTELTLSGYKRRYGKLMEYVDKSIFPDEVTRITLNRLDLEMTKKGYGKSYVYKCKAAIKMLVDFGVNHGLIESSLIGAKISCERKYDLKHLKPTEVNKIAKFKFATKRYQEIVDLYLFCCSTGMSYADQNSFKKSQIKNRGGKKYLKGTRKKTKSEYFLPLLPLAKKILKKYKYKLPKWSNQDCNSTIKEAFPIAGVNRYMKFHTSRKTFANYCVNHLLYSLEATAKMMGQKDMKELEAYVEVTNLRVVAETSKKNVA